AFAGTSVQDVEVFRLRNHFGNSARTASFQLYRDEEQVVHTYTCTFRSAKLDDFSVGEAQLAFTPQGDGFRNRIPGFTALIERGVFHPDEFVGFQAAATPGEIQELEIFRQLNDGTLLVERALVTAPYSLSPAGQDRWRMLEQHHEPAVAFHDEKPGNERLQGLVTGYTVCEKQNVVADYNPAFTGGLSYVFRSVEFYPGNRVHYGRLAERLGSSRGSSLLFRWRRRAGYAGATNRRPGHGFHQWNCFLSDCWRCYANPGWNSRRTDAHRRL
ncbi:MAG: hypothetical protein HY074_14750, partial [Deltaproteobacteria bacterium]|nr:hypothetical protein [Deltaproteobacteria bacterium]